MHEKLAFKVASAGGNVKPMRHAKMGKPLLPKGLALTHDGHGHAARGAF